MRRWQAQLMSPSFGLVLHQPRSHLHRRRRPFPAGNVRQADAVIASHTLWIIETVGSAYGMQSAFRS